MSPKSEFQNLSFRILRRKQCHCWYFTVLFALLSVAHSRSFFFIYFLLSIYVTVSRPCRLLEFYPKKASSMSVCKCVMHRNTPQVSKKICASFFVLSVSREDLGFRKWSH